MKSLVYYIFAGLGFALGYPFYKNHFSLLAPIIGNVLFYHALLIFFIRPGSKKRFVILGTLCSLFIANIIGFSWIPNAINLFSGLSGVRAFLVNTFFIILSYPPIWVIVIIILICKKPKIKKRIISFYNRYSLHTPVLFATLLILIGDSIPTLFPIKVGSSWIRFAPYLGLAPYFGIHFYSFLTHFISLEVLKYFHTKKCSLPSLLVLFLIFCFHLIFPLRPPENQSQINVRLIPVSYTHLTLPTIYSV